jgi:hypothetical protein
MDQVAVESEAAKTIGWDNKFLSFKVLLDTVTNEVVAEIQPRWINRLAGVLPQLSKKRVGPLDDRTAMYRDYAVPLDVPRSTLFKSIRATKRCRCRRSGPRETRRIARW